MKKVETYFSQESQRIRDRTASDSQESQESQLLNILNNGEDDSNPIELHNPPENYYSTLSYSDLVLEREELRKRFKHDVAYEDALDMITKWKQWNQDQSTQYLLDTESLNWIELLEDEDGVEKVHLIRSNFSEQSQKLEKICTLFPQYKGQIQHCIQALHILSHWYVIGQEYSKKNGLLHYHLVIGFKSKQSVEAVKLLFPCLHIEYIRTTIKRAIGYSTKETLYDQFGQIPGDLLSKTDQEYQEILTLCRTGNTELIQKVHPAFFIKHHSVIEKILANIQYEAMQQQRKILTREELRKKNLFIWGPPAIGKSYAAMNLAGLNPYEKNEGQWFDGFGNYHTGIVFNDMQPNGSWPIRLMNLILDTYPFIGQVKGGSVIVQPSNLPVILTSNFSVDEILDSIGLNTSAKERIKTAVRSRISEVHMYPEDHWFQVEITGPYDSAKITGIISDWYLEKGMVIRIVNKGQ